MLCYTHSRSYMVTKFDIDADPTNGVALVANSERLTVRCKLPSEIDSCVAELKRELDQTAEMAKSAILSMENLPDFPTGPN
ncbi:hypothetical protein OO17_21115 [Rhodopseudomonas palustris]|uniref:Uncharacterized protein n=1 Tax=Rhodopseudomonas palustris TaxID=1076 RepID=A0A0D7EEQ6_RHOPL|nr:hypothetical protein OO17_21115 [Rhodopseudomonas palustris]